MRRVARITLAMTLALGSILVLPRGGATGSQALAQIPLPTLSPTLLDPDPTPTPPPTEPSPSPTSEGGGDGGSGSGGTTTDETDSKKDDGTKSGSETKRKRKRPGGGEFVGPFRPSGSFTTDRLVARAAQLRSLGVSTPEVIEKVFPPFIIAGHAAWTNTWGAPRYGPAPGQRRRHQGQDVFCDYGAPVLAAVPGTVSFGDGGLGGKVARVHTADGGYLYYAHLSNWNTKQFDQGDRVEVGDVIGTCGNSGNALSTPPHVHFGHYNGDGVAVDPMRELVRWLRQAERRTGVLVENATNERTKEIASITLSRRFGDAFMPDTSQLSLAGDALWASGSSPGIGIFTLADIALRTALSDSLFEAELHPVSGDRESRDVLRSMLTPSAILTEITADDDHAHTETAD
ncbi:MAG: peptidoglycan DD-metalloendopeptidase family protein [Actinobacteria bacterium]|nr:peptidoglycan DD-metalloendopeptidase family protein [Actinomycetota bacterium]